MILTTNMKGKRNNILSRLISFASKNKYINKYTITLVIFIISYVFFTNYSYLETQKLKHQIRKTEDEIEYYKEAISLNKEKKQALESDKQEVEKYAREQLNMKKKNEDLYYIKEK